MMMTYLYFHGLRMTSFVPFLYHKNKFIFYKLKSFEVLHKKENDVRFTRGGIFLSKIVTFR